MDGDKRSPPTKQSEVIQVSKEMRLKQLNMQKEALKKKLLKIEDQLEEVHMQIDKEMELGV